MSFFIFSPFLSWIIISVKKMINHLLPGCLLLLLSILTNGQLTEEHDMLQWMHDIHQFPKGQNVTIATFPITGDPFNATRRGLKTKINFTRGDPILTIPRKAFMSRATARASKIGEVFQALENILGDKWLLAVHLLYEWLDPSSLWRSYLDTIPPPNPIKTTSVLFWNEHDLATLQCSRDLQCQVVDRIRKEQHAAQTMYREIQPLMESYFPTNSFTYNHFAWAYGTVKARCFTINVTKSYGGNFLKDDATLKEGLMSILVPFGDLFNHHNSKPPLQHGAYEFNDEHDSLILKADQNYTKNDEVFISYGILTNPDLLLSYGFVLLDNPFETVGFRLNVHEETRAAKNTNFQSQADWNTGEEGGRDIDDATTVLSPMTKIRKDMYVRRGLWTVEDDAKGAKVMETHIGLDGRTSPAFMEALRVHELRWCDLVECTDKSEAASNGFPPPPPTASPPLPTTTTAEQGHDGMNLDTDLKRAVAEAMHGMFPGESDQSTNTPVGSNNDSPAPPKTTKTPEITETERKKIENAVTIAKKIDVSKPWNGKHEANVHDVLLRGAESLLRSYPTSLSVDVQLLGRVPVDGRSSPKMTESSLTLTPRTYQALLMRIETKRILHSIVLECLYGIKKAHNMSSVSRRNQLQAEKPLPNNADTHTKGMGKKRNNIHQKMNQHFATENIRWIKLWEEWRRSVYLTWGGGELSDPTIRDSVDEEVKRVIALNARHIAEQIHEKEKKKNKNTNTCGTKTTTTQEQQQQQDLEKFSARGGGGGGEEEL